MPHYYFRNYLGVKMAPRKTKRAPRDTYNYELTGMFGETVYHGITNDPDRRIQEHARSGKTFNGARVSSARSRMRADSDETKAIHQYQDNNIFGTPPRYNKAKVKDPDPDPLGLFGRPSKRGSKKNNDFGFGKLF